jgi:hypothetical protein
MLAGTFIARYIEHVLGPAPTEPPEARTDPDAKAKWEDVPARRVMEEGRVLLQRFLLPGLGGSVLLDAMHNDMDRGLTGSAPRFIRAIDPVHGNTRDTHQHTAREAFVYTVILEAAERDGTDRVQKVLNEAGVGVNDRTFRDMRQTVADKAGLARIVAEADRLRDNRRLRQKAARRGQQVDPQQERPMATELIAGAVTDAEKMALYPKDYRDLAPLTLPERLKYLFECWNRGGRRRSFRIT